MNQPRLAAPLFLALLLAVIGPLAPWPLAAQAESPVLDLASYPQDNIRVIAAGGRTHDFRVWIADTAERQRQGLMYVRDLPSEQGMLFINDTSRVSSFWMKNTYIPLDMLFIDASGRIVEIFANTTPLSLEPVGSSKPVRAVLELRGGESARRGLRKGDQVQHPTFGGSGRR